MKQKLIQFLAGKTGYVSVNEFLKSCYPQPGRNEPFLWDNQQQCKMLKGVLEELQSERLISVKGNRHRELGSFFYIHKDSSQVTQFHGLKTINIEVESFIKAPEKAAEPPVAAPKEEPKPVTGQSADFPKNQEVDTKK